ncbi:MAG: anaerobic glycerol-3-phosphate dehydrogenase subunit B [Bacteroidales bacterium]|nr:anaerobic glycerol-3-phosphate dehydrogenase subunit B [Bacteroidales bacterium]
MKFQTIIVGGGLAGLTAGLALQKKGISCAIISSGENALHFSSGTFSGDCPEETVRLFEEAGIVLKGDPAKDSWRLTPSGSMQKVRLAFEDVTLYPSEKINATNVLIANPEGFIDFPTAFIADGISQQGIPCKVKSFSLPCLKLLRESPSEMRSVGIAKKLDGCIEEVAECIKGLLDGEDLVILPQVFGLASPEPVRALRAAIPAEINFIGTMPPSVPGIRVQLQLKKAFERAGGTFLMGDTAIMAEIADGTVRFIRTKNLDSHILSADNYILASGTFFSKGLTSSMQKISEPLFGLDVECPEERTEWYSEDFFAPQPYMAAGVKTDKDLHPLRDGQPISNLYAAGSILAGKKNAGMALTSTFKVVKKIAL